MIRTIDEKPERSFFVSHSSADREFVTWLSKELVARCIPVWYSDWEIKIGDSITGMIDGALDQMAGLIIVLSRSSVKSKWVREELNAGLARHLEDHSISIFPVRLDDCAIPPLLGHRRFADFSSDRDKALAELAESLIPEATLIERIRELKREFNELKATLTHPVDALEDFGAIVGQINALLENAAEVRYAIEVRKTHNTPHEHSGFFERFDFLVERGYDLRNPDWGMVVMMRNMYAHSMGNALAKLHSAAALKQDGHPDAEKWYGVELDRITDIFDTLLVDNADPAKGG